MEEMLVVKAMRCDFSHLLDKLEQKVVGTSNASTFFTFPLLIMFIEQQIRLLADIPIHYFSSLEWLIQFKLVWNSTQNRGCLEYVALLAWRKDSRRRFLFKVCMSM
jgi:hypothetical protein